MLRYFFSALILCWVTSTNSAELSGLQTFFTSKTERQQLDRLRDSDAFKNQQGQTVPEQSAPDILKLHGVVIREQGKPVFFVNDENTLYTHHLSNGVEVREHLFKSDNYSVPLRVKGDRLKLRPGEQWDSSDRKVEEAYQINATSPAPDGVAQPR